MSQAKILYRHPDPNVRALPPKPLEFRSKKDDDDDEVFFPEHVDGKVIYTLPQKYAKRLLANQPERYFLLEPAQLVVKMPINGGLQFKYETVAANPALLSKFQAEDQTAADKAAKAAQAKADREAKAKEERDAKAKEEADAKARADADAKRLAELESAPLGTAPSGRPPEL